MVKEDLQFTGHKFILYLSKASYNFYVTSVATVPDASAAFAKKAINVTENRNSKQ